jgi:phosphocarrier protein HPr
LHRLIWHEQTDERKKTAGWRVLHQGTHHLNKLGIHARPAAMFVKTANRFACDIFVEKDGEKINGKSIMGLMMLAAGPGSKLTCTFAARTPMTAIAEIEALVQTEV